MHLNELLIFGCKGWEIHFCWLIHFVHVGENNDLREDGSNEQSGANVRVKQASEALLVQTGELFKVDIMEEENDERKVLDNCGGDVKQ